MKYLGILNAMVITDANNPKEAHKQMDRLCNDLTLTSDVGTLFCTKASRHLTKINLSMQPSPSAPNVADAAMAISSITADAPGFEEWMERAVDVGLNKTDWFCSGCGYPAYQKKTKYCPNCGARMLSKS